MTRITAQFTNKTATELHEAIEKKKSSADAKKILDVVHSLSGKINPMHPGIEEPSLASYFVVELAKSADAKKAIAKLNQLPGITAAYVKPKEELA